MYNNCLYDILAWSNKILPTVFDDSLSYLESIYRLKEVVKELIEKFNVLTESNIELTNKYDETITRLEGIEKQLDDFIKGYTIADGSITVKMLSEEVIETIKDTTIETVYNISKPVCFGLDDNGYFIAILPRAWEGLEFETNTENRLVLKY